MKKYKIVHFNLNILSSSQILLSTFFVSYKSIMQNIIESESNTKIIHIYIYIEQNITIVKYFCQVFGSISQFLFVWYYLLKVLVDNF